MLHTTILLVECIEILNIISPTSPSYILKQTWCLSVCLFVCVFVTDTRPLDLMAPRSNSPLICGPRWLCERRIRAALGIWARGKKKQRNILHTRTHVRMHARFPHPMLSLRTRMGTHPQILASGRIYGHDQDLGISISSSSSLLLLRGFLTRSLCNKLLYKKIMQKRRFLLCTWVPNRTFSTTLAFPGRYLLATPHELFLTTVAFFCCCLFPAMATAECCQFA